MSQTNPSRPPSQLAGPPFVRLPDPAALFATRAWRLRALAEGQAMGPYLQFVAGLAEIQDRILAGLPEPQMPPAEARRLARDHAMPPLDRRRLAADPAADAALLRLAELAGGLDMPDTARTALGSVAKVDAEGRQALFRAVLDDAIPVEALAEHVYAAAALQVHFARLAAGLEADRLVPVGDGLCPVCGGPPVASLVVGWPRAEGARYCSCALCGTLWNYVRIRCVLCGSTKGIGYREVEGGTAVVKAEVCDSCHGYVKVLDQQKDPDVEPMADDIASLALDLLVAREGFRRGAVNPFLLGY
jgi:FdhE protein